MTATATPPTITMIQTSDLESFQNIRAADRDITELAASLTRVGVLEPLIVAPDQIDQTPNSTSVHAQRWVVIAGNRRLAAAKKAKIAAVPCIIRTDIGSDLRIIETQLAENLQRDPLTLKEETIAFQKLELAGMTATDIGKVAGRKKTQVDARLKLLDLPETTRGKVWDGQITLDEADVLASFADDPEAVAWLEKYVGTPSFAWQKNNWKYEKERRAKAAKEKQAQAAEKARVKAETDAAKKAGTPIPKPKTEPKQAKQPWQIEQEQRKAREAAMQPVIEASYETRFPWIRDRVQVTAASTIKVDPLQRGLLRAAAETLLNTTIFDFDPDGDARAWLGLNVEGKDTDITTLTDGQLLVLVALASSLVHDPLNEAWAWRDQNAHGPMVTRQLVQYLDYPISPEEQALANGDVS
jgi:ParB/RepB/Spo0J family partition protein